jgi:hypothetical protein
VPRGSVGPKPWEQATARARRKNAQEAPKSEVFEELFACLNAQSVKALIAGGYAVAFHAKPR